MIDTSGIEADDVVVQAGLVLPGRIGTRIHDLLELLAFVQKEMNARATRATRIDQNSASIPG
jgi:hypothetical protein